MFVVLFLRPLEKLLKRSLLSLQAENEVARFEGIVISDGDDNPSFRETVLAALQLIKELDPRRFRRIQRYIKWVVNVPLAHGGGEYAYSMHTCRIDFEQSVWQPWGDQAFVLCADVLIHEATHGVLNARNIPYSSQLRSRIERLCVREGQRFLSRVSEARPEVAKALCHEFDESRWHRSWRETRWESLLSTVKRLLRYRRIQKAQRQLAHR